MGDMWKPILGAVAGALIVYALVTLGSLDPLWFMREDLVCPTLREDALGWADCRSHNRWAGVFRVYLGMTAIAGFCFGMAFRADGRR